MKSFRNGNHEKRISIVPNENYQKGDPKFRVHALLSFHWVITKYPMKTYEKDDPKFRVTNQSTQSKPTKTFKWPMESYQN